MQQQDIVWVSVPFSSLEESKIRPALIVSNNDYNAKNADVVICAITSNLEKKPYAVFISQENLSDGILPIPSKIRADKIMQLEKNKIGKNFGRLNDKTFDSVIQGIGALLSRSR